MNDKVDDKLLKIPSIYFKNSETGVRKYDILSLSVI